MNRLLFKHVNKTYGGYEYVEVDLTHKVFATGTSRAHMGHGQGSVLETCVSKKKDLSDITDTLTVQGYTEVNNIREFHDNLK